MIIANTKRTHEIDLEGKILEQAKNTSNSAQ